MTTSLNLPTFLFLSLSLGACVVPKLVGDVPQLDSAEDDATLGASSDSDSTSEPGITGDEATGSAWATMTTPNDLSEPSPETDTGDDSDTLGPGTTTGDDTGPAMVCPTREAFLCAHVTDCIAERCGELGSPFDAEGCPRTPCNTTECDDGEVCYRPGAWGFEGCSPTLTGAVNGDNGCEYTYDDECGGNYCISADESPPPADCPAFTDADECLGAGCSAFAQAIPVVIEDNVCSCGDPLPQCVWLPPASSPLEAAPGLFFQPGSGEVVLFAGPWPTAPHGWSKCFGDPAEPLACQSCREFALENCG